MNSSSYNTMISACVKAGKPEAAEAWLRRLVASGSESTVRSYTAVIEGWAKNGNTAKAEEVFNEMSMNNIEPTVVTFTSLAKAYARRGKYQRVESIMDELRSAGLGMNTYFLCGLLTAYANARPVPRARAEQMFREICTRDSIHPDKHVLGALAKAVGQERCNDLCSELQLGQANYKCGSRGVNGRQMPKQQHSSTF